MIAVRIRMAPIQASAALEARRRPAGPIALERSGGAEILAQHPGLVNGMGDGPGAIKPVVVAALVAQLAAFAAMWIIDFQSPSV